MWVTYRDKQARGKGSKPKNKLRTIESAIWASQKAKDHTVGSTNKPWVVFGNWMIDTDDSVLGEIWTEKQLVAALVNKLKKLEMSPGPKKLAY